MNFDFLCLRFLKEDLCTHCAIDSDNTYIWYNRIFPRFYIKSKTLFKKD